MQHELLLKFAERRQVLNKEQEDHAEDLLLKREVQLLKGGCECKQQLEDVKQQQQQDQERRQEIKPQLTELIKTPVSDVTVYLLTGGYWRTCRPKTLGFKATPLFQHRLL